MGRGGGGDVETRCDRPFHLMYCPHHAGQASVNQSGAHFPYIFTQVPNDSPDRDVMDQLQKIGTASRLRRVLSTLPRGVTTTISYAGGPHTVPARVLRWRHAL
jgi:hypothetical protein